MELKEDLENADIKDLLMEHLEYGDYAKIDGKITLKNLDKLNKSLELIKQNNWENTYIVLYH